MNIFAKTKPVSLKNYEITIELCFNGHVTYHSKNRALDSRIHIRKCEQLYEVDELT
jgi:ribosomal protein L31